MLPLNNLQCFYIADKSSNRFELDYHQIVNVSYPSWSLEAKFISHMQKQGEPNLYFKPHETFNGRPHVFRFKIVTDEQGNEWYSYVGLPLGSIDPDASKRFLISGG